jgi:hypothetical protein
MKENKCTILYCVCKNFCDSGTGTVINYDSGTGTVINYGSGSAKVRN